MRRALVLLAGLAAWLVIASPASAGKKPPPPPEDFWGVFAFELPSAGEFEQMASQSIGTYRLFLYWRAIERREPTTEKVLPGDVTLPDEEVAPGEKRTTHYYEWEEVDKAFRRASAAGVDIHLSVYGSPGWLAADQQQNPARTQKGMRMWQDFIGAAADRYAAGGEFWSTNPGVPESPPVAWQIWNEMNTSARFKPGARPKQYAELLAAAGAEIRARDSATQVMPGGMFGTPQTPDSMPAWTFLERLLEEDIARPYVDAVGVHPYSPTLRGIKYQIRKLRGVLKRAGMNSTPIELTEIGWSSGLAPKFFLMKGRKGQEKMLKKSMRLLLKKRTKWKIQRVIWLSWRDFADPPEGCGFCEKFGLLKLNGDPKPAYKTYTRFSRRSG